MTKMTPNVGEDILDVVNKTPGIRTQMISMQVGVTHSTVWRMLWEQLYPYHQQSVHQLLLQDYPAQAMFCQWFSQECGKDPNFPAFVIFMDGA